MRYRIEYEKRVIGKMIRLYCLKKEGNRELCPSCAELLEYSLNRLDRCFYGDNKYACKKCPVHCYRHGMKERIRVVMRFSGPRMLLYHPVDALRHLFN